MQPYEISVTPNPNSLKFTTHTRFIDHGMVVARSALEAAAHPLSAHLFALHDVCDILILGDFLTITKQPGASWDTLLPDVQRILDAHLSE